ncbi:MAG: glucosidase [Proteobacteria bacterium]|nr:glucosidase [Pseudomonadota bacterium]
MPDESNITAEDKRLAEERESGVPWKAWGPYLSERQWGTVREDYSRSGDAWEHFSHDQARSRVYRWGEDGLAGISDDKQRLCFALALWNGRDPIIKERLFGLTNREGNHGEDVKEYYYYLDSTPTHAYMKYLYKYPQEAYPYDDLVRKNRARGQRDMEYELIDTGVFEGDRYFDTFVEYAKATPHDILMRITLHNRSDREWTLHVLPTLWFRNTWSWSDGGQKPLLEAVTGVSAIRVVHPDLGELVLSCEGDPELLFTENETNLERLAGVPNRTPYVKDAIHRFVVGGVREAVNPARTGTKMAACYRVTVGAKQSAVLRLRLSRVSDVPRADGLGTDFDEIFTARIAEADAFYASITPPRMTDDQRLVMRQALAGMLWSKQFYGFDVYRWLGEHGVDALSGNGAVRNRDWFHMMNEDIISMPDKWEYPWYASWDLAFHTIALAMVDLDFAKQQLQLVLKETYLHPNGQIPAYEWNFGDVNPPVHPWAAIYLYLQEKATRGKGDIDFLKAVFGKLMMNFTWWVNRKDRAGRNVFEGGFLGLDNIGVFDRSSPLPTGGYLEQADGTAWMVLFAQTMLQITLELTVHDPTYEEMAIKFLEHFMWIALSVYKLGSDGRGMWDEQDGFFYDVIRSPDGRSQPLKVRSMVGLLPLCATTSYDARAIFSRLPSFAARIRRRVKQHPELKQFMSHVGREGEDGGRLMSLVDEHRLRRILSRVLDENEFLSPYGIRSLSRFHGDHPFVMHVAGQEHRVDYAPAESTTGMFGGNSNWRGPIWLPVNVLLVRALLQYYQYFGDGFTIECPTGSGRSMTLYQVADEIVRRLSSIFVRNEAGQRPVFGGARTFQDDPHFRDHLLFYEYFHGDNGAGLGASHQTGWTGLIAPLMHLFASYDVAVLERYRYKGTPSFKQDVSGAIQRA